MRDTRVRAHGRSVRASYRAHLRGLTERAWFYGATERMGGWARSMGRANFADLHTKESRVNSHALGRAQPSPLHANTPCRRGAMRRQQREGNVARDSRRRRRKGVVKPPFSEIRILGVPRTAAPDATTNVVAG